MKLSRIAVILLVSVFALAVLACGGPPKAAVDYNNRGVEAFNKGNYTEAIADYNQSIKLDPSLAETFSNRGHAYSELGEMDNALADFNQSIKLNPNFAVA